MNIIAKDSTEKTETEDHSIDLLVRSDASIQINNRKQKQHSAIVRKMRLILPVVALGIVAILMTWQSDDAPVTAVPRESVSPQTVSQNELINPKFQSEDSSSQPYNITADKALQNADNMDHVQLINPKADLSLKSGGAVSLQATNGQYSQGDKTLALDGDVEVWNDGGYKLHTQKMQIDVTGQTITSDQPVHGEGSSAKIEAAGLSVNGQDKTVVFTGPAKLILQKNISAPPQKGQ